MNLSTQLRIILLLAGAIILLAIYWWGRRRSSSERPALADPAPQSPAADTSALFETTDPQLEDELDTPAYMRRAGMREQRQDYEPRIADADDFADIEELHEPAPRIVSMDIDEVHATIPPVHETDDIRVEPVYVEPAYTEPAYVEPAYVEPGVIHREPMRAIPQDSRSDDIPVAPPRAIETHAAAAAPLPTSIPVMAEPITTMRQSYNRERSIPPPPSTPTLSQAVPDTRAQTEPSKPTSKPSAARRKIIALRVPMAMRVPGAQLLSLLQAEKLQHGKFNIFHRMAESAINGGTVFSVASMVEPGSFDLAHMAEQQFPGVTMFMLLPGPLDGLIAYDQMLSCAQRIAQATGAELHDERGARLTPQTMERLRDEVLDFQHLIGGTAPH